MDREQTPVYAPDLDETDPLERIEDSPGRRALIFTLVIAVFATFAGVVWSVYSPDPGAPALIEAQAEPFKVAAAPAEAASDAQAEGAFFERLEATSPLAQTRAAAAQEPSGPVDLRPRAPTAPAIAPPPAVETRALPAPAPAPTPTAAGPVAADGGFVVQIAAVRSEAAARTAWADAARRAGALERAKLDLSRADLGAQGVFYRVRAGYFPDRAAASAFCAELMASGLQCMVAAR